MNNNDEAQRYSKRNIVRSEQIYGEGFQSPGGVSLTRKLLDDYFYFSDLIDNNKTLNILDVGCGLGGLEKLLVDQFDNINITGMDISPEMIEICQERYFENTRMKFLVGDVLNQDLFDNGTFDIVITRDCMLYVENKNQLWGNINHWLKYQGKLILTDFGRGIEIFEYSNTYYKKCDYHLKTFEQYSKNLSDNNFVIDASGNITHLFNHFNSLDLEKFEDKKDHFLSTYDEDDYNYIINRWTFKINQSEKKEMLYYYFSCTKK